MKRYLILMLVLNFVVNLNAQVFQWAEQFSEGEKSMILGLDKTVSGDLYAVGKFSGTVDFDPGTGIFYLTSAGESDAFVVKLDASGNFIWAKQIGGTGDDYFRAVSLSVSGNIYLTGGFYGSIDADPGQGTHMLNGFGERDMMVVELDENGNYVWSGAMGGMSDDYAVNILTNGSADVYISGYFLGTSDFDPSDTGEFYLSAAGQSIFIMKLNSDNSFAWAGVLGGSGFDYCSDMCIDNNGNVITTGMFQGPADFDPGDSVYILNSVGDRDIYVNKLDADGNFVWAKAMGGPMIESGQGIDCTEDGSIYFTGNFEGTVDFDPDENNTIAMSALGENDAFVEKLTAEGNFVWVKQFSDIENIRPAALVLDAEENVYTTGLFEGTAVFQMPRGDDYLDSFGDYDTYMCKLDSDGNFVWVAQAGGIDTDRGLAMIVDDQDNLFTGGFFTGTADFDPVGNGFSMTGTGEFNAFVLKLNTGLLGVEQSRNEVISFYPNPAKSVVFVESDRKFLALNVAVFDVTGKKVMEKVYTNSDRVAVKLPDEKGIYFIRMTNGDGNIKTFKVLKN